MDRTTLPSREALRAVDVDLTGKAVLRLSVDDAGGEYGARAFFHGFEPAHFGADSNP